MTIPTGWITAGWALVFAFAVGFGWVLGTAVAAKLVGRWK